MANGPDLIPCHILKEAATEIAPFLKLLFTQSMESGIMPNDWLKADITPVFKKGNKHLASNYRPISLTAVPCKILEHVIFHDILYTWILTYSSQFSAWLQEEILL